VAAGNTDPQHSTQHDGGILLLVGVCRGWWGAVDVIVGEDVEHTSGVWR